MMKQRASERNEKKCVEDTLLKGPECETIWMPIISQYVLYIYTHIFFRLII